MTLSIIFATYTRNGFKKLQCERTFEKRQVLSVENILVLKFDKAILKK